VLIRAGAKLGRISDKARLKIGPPHVIGPRRVRYVRERTFVKANGRSALGPKQTFAWPLVVSLVMRSPREGVKRSSWSCER
jgi:hypothetical protein